MLIVNTYSLFSSLLLHSLWCNSFCQGNFEEKIICVMLCFIPCQRAHSLIDIIQVDN